MEVDKLEGRLLIEKVVLKNFKSYAGEKTIGPFHTNLTSVVGPNGSGKSNLLESLLFAFGKRARKMRLKKLSELIHHSHNFPNLTEASVEVYFLNIIDTDTGYSEVPNSRLVLLRLVRANSSSEYRLNGKLSSFEEVTSTLKFRGIDLEHNRFLILQGEVEQIAMMKPKAPPGDDNKTGLLEYLEEIIGTDQYVPDIERAEKELETIGDEVASKKMRVEEAKKITDQLEGPMKEAVAYIELEKECLQFKSLKCRLEKHKKVMKTTEVNSLIQGLDEQLLNIEKDFNDKKKENEQAIQEYEKKANEIKNIDKQRQKLEVELTDLVNIENVAAEESKKLKSLLNQLEKDKQINEKRISDIKIDIEELEKKIPTTSSDLETIKERKTIIEKEFSIKSNQVQVITEALQKEKNSLDSETQPIKRTLMKAKAEKDAKVKEIEFLTKEIENGDFEKEKILKSLEEIDENLKKQNSEILSLKKNFEKNAKSLEIKNKEIQELNVEIEKNSKNLRDLKNSVLTAEREEKKFYENKGKISEILRAKMEGVLTGLHGRLGDLGQISGVYDAAVSSAFGGLDNIVVDSVSNGDELLRFVREKRLGKVTIIVLEKTIVDERRMNNFTSPASNAIRLFDHIKFNDNKFKAAFYSVFGDTLFTENIEDARKIAFGEKRFKVVTSNGNIINPSGEMRGFSQPFRGKMRLVGSNTSVVNIDNLETLKKEQNKVFEFLEALNVQRNQKEAEFYSEKNSERQLKQQINLQENEISSKNERKSNLNERLKVLESRSLDEIRGSILSLTKIVEQSEINNSKLEKIISKKNQQILEIEKKIEEAAGEDFKALKTLLKTLQTDEENLEKESSKLHATYAQRQKDLEKYSKQFKKIDEEVFENSKNFEECKKKRNEYKEQAMGLAENLKKIEESLEERKNLIFMLKNQQELIKKEFDQILASRDFVKQEKKEKLGHLRHLEIEIQRWQTKLENFITEYNNLIEEYSPFYTGIEIDPIIDHQNKKNKNYDERLSLRKPVDWVCSEEDLFSLVDKLFTIEEIEKTLETELSLSSPNLKIIEDYKTHLLEKNSKENDLNEAKIQETELKTLYNDYKNKRLTEFTRGFREISNKLREMYRLLTRGGDAELELADSTDPFSEGIVFTVRPPNKSWKKMANLSGGEKTLSSLALVFALHHYKPNALYVMDEVDAALDFQNVSIIAGYIKGQTKNAQCIVVSLSYQMFEVADQLVGIYKTKDVSHSLCISPFSLKEISTENQIISQTLQNIAIKD